MSSKKKAGELLPKIIEATDRNSAIKVLNDVLEALYLTHNYTELVGLKDTLSGYEAKYKEISNRYRNLESPKTFDAVHDIRVDLNFLYRDIVDELDFDVNRLKIYYEEVKTSVRADSMLSLKEDEDFQAKIKANSTSALRDIVGADDGYKEYVSLASISYGLYQNLRNLLNSVRQMTDSLASESAYLRNIELKEG